MENNINIKYIQDQIKELKLEILEKEKQIDSLLRIINNEDYDTNYENESETEI